MDVQNSYKEGEYPIIYLGDDEAYDEIVGKIGRVVHWRRGTAKYHTTETDGTFGWAASNSEIENYELIEGKRYWNVHEENFIKVSPEDISKKKPKFVKGDLVECTVEANGAFCKFKKGMIGIVEGQQKRDDNFFDLQISTWSLIMGGEGEIYNKSISSIWVKKICSTKEFEKKTGVKAVSLQELLRKGIINIPQIHKLLGVDN